MDPKTYFRFLWWHAIRPQPWPSEKFPIAPFQSHRGLRELDRDENTLAAFRRSADRGAIQCECDVQLTGDDVPVVYHDEFLSRLHGRSERVRDTLLRDLREIVNIPTLEEVLADDGGPKFFNLELKTRSLKSRLPERITRIVRNAQAEDRVMLSSFNPFALKLMETLLPRAPRALLVTDKAVSENPWYLREMLFAPLLKIHMLNLEQTMLTPEMISYWKSRQMPLAAWTVNNAEEAKRLISLGVQSVISDLDPKSISLG